MTQTFESDVAVVGAGIAGVVTALELVRRGKSVTLIEREGPDRFGGSALEAFGGLFFVDSPEQRRMGIKDSPERAFADWSGFAQFGADDETGRVWARRIIERATPDGHDYLKRHGITWLPVVLWVERGFGEGGNSVPRFHLTWGTGKRVATQLTAALRQAGQGGKLNLLFSHRVDRLERNGAAVTGCSGVSDAGQDFTVRAGATVVAAGGIGGDLEAVKQHWRVRGNVPPPDDMLLGTHPGADGRVVAAAYDAGARVSHQERMWNYAAGIAHPRPHWPGHGVSLIPPKSALWVDAHGKRIGPRPLVSGFDTYDLVEHVATAPFGYTWQILNQKIALKELAASGAEWNPAIRERSMLRFLRDMLVGNKVIVEDFTKNSPDLVTAANIDALAAGMNRLAGADRINASALREALAAFDATLDAPNPAEADQQREMIERLRAYRGDKMRLSQKVKILDPKHGPLIAIRERIVTRKSLGGIVTDLQSRAVDPSGAPVPGLYAVGESAGFGGGGSHGLRALEGTFLLSCVLTGQAAARSIGDGR